MISISRLCLVALFCPGCVAAQSASPYSSAGLAAQTTIPITFTKTLDANHVKSGDTVTAKTIQAIRLSDGRAIKAGAQITGHISEVQSFAFDKTPYAKQKPGVLGMQMDWLVTQQGEKIPMHVYLRAMADTFATNAAYTPRPSDEDSLHSTTQVGGDILTPSQSEVVNPDGDVVGYNRRDGVYAHLIANAGPGSTHCDGSGTEQSVAQFSASACGLYGFIGTDLISNGFGSDPSGITLASRRSAPKIFRGSTALLETVPTTSVASTAH